MSAINQQSSGPTLYPRTAVAAAACSLVKTGGDPKIATAFVQRYIATAEAVGHRFLWAHTVPHNVVLLVPDQGVGAVAELISADLTETGSPAVTLTVDVVHAPRMTSELVDHPKQTLDENAHYHFLTPAGVSIKAAKFLSVLQGAGNKLQGTGASMCMAHTARDCSSHV